MDPDPRYGGRIAFEGALDDLVAAGSTLTSRVSRRTATAPEGAGGHVIWIDPDHDLVVVLGWVKADAPVGRLVRVVDAIR